MNQINASETALLIVHLQGDIVSEGTAFGALFSTEYTARGIVGKINTAAKLLRDSGGLVVPLRIAFAHDYSDLNPTLPLLQMVGQAGCLKEGTDGAALVPDLVVTGSDVVTTHKRPGPFTDSPLQPLLQERGIKSVIVCGVATNASVEGAARQAADLGYHTLVLTDAASAADPTTHEASLASLSLFATLTTVATLPQHLS
ncbi:cysteine hydrolase [Nonomuraea wenchangensis]